MAACSEAIAGADLDFPENVPKSPRLHMVQPYFFSSPNSVVLPQHACPVITLTGLLRQWHAPEYRIAVFVNGDFMGASSKSISRFVIDSSNSQWYTFLNCAPSVGETKLVIQENGRSNLTALRCCRSTLLKYCNSIRNAERTNGTPS